MCSTEKYFLLPVGGVVLDRQWLSPGVCCCCLPPWHCHTALSMELLMARGGRRRPQQVAAMPYSTARKVYRATDIAGTAEGTAAGVPRLELGCYLTGPCNPWPDLRMMGQAWKVSAQ